MKKVLSIVSLALLCVYCAAVAIVVISPINHDSKGEWCVHGGDFSLRMAEIDCMLRGVNPYDVWHGDVVLKPYIPLGGEHDRAGEGEEGFSELINAYVPWEYMMMMPFALLPRAVAWVLYFFSMLGALGILFWRGGLFARRFASRDVGVCREDFAIVGALPILLVALPLYQNLQVGNLTVYVLLASVFMAACLGRGRNVMAGVCWAVAMLKPQLALPFAIPLLMMRKFTTCLVAAATCAALTLVSSLVCNASPVDLVVQGVSASKHAFRGCGTFPLFLCQYMPGDVGIYAGVLVGAAICAVLTRMLLRSGVRDWLVILMPAAVIGAAWTYAQCYSFTMNWFFFLALSAAVVRCPRSPFLWSVALVSALIMTRLSNFLHFAPKAFPGFLPDIVPSMLCHYHIDSIVSFAGVVVVVLFCAWLSRRAASAELNRLPAQCGREVAR